MKITNDDAIYILGYKKKHRFEAWFCNWTLESDTLICKMSWPSYIAMGIPCIVIEFFYCLFASGLLNFQLPSDLIHYRILTEEEMKLAEERLGVKWDL